MPIAKATFARWVGRDVLAGVLACSSVIASGTAAAVEIGLAYLSPGFGALDSPRATDAIRAFRSAHVSVMPQPGVPAGATLHLRGKENDR